MYNVDCSNAQLQDGQPTLSDSTEAMKSGKSIKCLRAAWAPVRPSALQDLKCATQLDCNSLQDLSFFTHLHHQQQQILFEVRRSGRAHDSGSKEPDGSEMLSHLGFSQAARPTQLGSAGLQDLELTQGAMDHAFLLLRSCLLLLHALCATTERSSAANLLRPDAERVLRYKFMSLSCQSTLR